MNRVGNSIKIPLTVTYRGSSVVNQYDAVKSINVSVEKETLLFNALVNTHPPVEHDEELALYIPSYRTFASAALISDFSLLKRISVCATVLQHQVDTSYCTVSHDGQLVHPVYMNFLSLEIPLKIPERLLMSQRFTVQVRNENDLLTARLLGVNKPVTHR